VCGELLAEQIRLGADSLNQLMNLADIPLGRFEIVAESFHPFESRADVVGVRFRDHASVSPDFMRLSLAETPG